MDILKGITKIERIYKTVAHY